MAELHTLLTGLVVGESPRWHEGRLWFSNWGAEEIIAVDPDGTSEVIARGPRRAGYSIDWLPWERFSLIISHRFPFADVQEALATASTPGAAEKVVVTFD